jgi:succinate dehydrogenase / fumarate reductase iron-sulfur subunit
VSAPEGKLLVRVRRQDGPDELDTRRWETFSLTRAPSQTVADVLRAIERDPRTHDGREVTPVVWADHCQWPACGVCALRINGRARPACTTLVAEAAPKARPLILEPLATFPLRRDLWIDRTRLQRDEALLASWLPEDDDTALAGNAEAIAVFLRCTRCGACLDACPETHASTAFAGPAAVGLAHAAQLARPDPRRLDALLEPAGIAGCGFARNCVEACPEAIPLDDALAAASRAATGRWLRALFRRKR